MCYSESTCDKCCEYAEISFWGRSLQGPLQTWPVKLRGDGNLASNMIGGEPRGRPLGLHTSGQTPKVKGL